MLKAKLGDDDYLRSDISDTDSDHRRDDPHQIFSQDQIFSRLFGAEEKTSANYAANEALITASADIEASTAAEEAEFASLAEYHVIDDTSPGELVCTLLVPELHHHDNSSLLTPDSDRDSGCFSEELGVRNSGEQEECGPRLSGVDTNLTENREVCKLKRGKSVQHLTSPRPSYRPAHNYTGGPRPFQRKIWKRRNGWFRVRYPVSGLARAQGVRSPLSETAEVAAPSHGVRAESEFLTAREVARECGELELRLGSETEITSEQELSDNDQGLEIFPDTSDTIKANGDRDSSPASQYSGDISAPGGRPVSELQAQLARMRLEIARMVEEAEERLDTSDILEVSEEEEDVSHWHLDYDESSGSESDALEIMEGPEFSCSDETDKEI